MALEKVFFETKAKGSPESIKVLFRKKMKGNRYKMLHNNKTITYVHNFKILE